MLYSNLENHFPSSELKIRTKNSKTGFPMISLFNNGENKLYIRYSSNINSYTEIQLSNAGIGATRRVNGVDDYIKNYNKFLNV